MKFAIIETGGKQYKVSPKQKIKVEKLTANEGDGFSFDKVLLVVDGEKVEVGHPHLEGRKVEGKIIKQARAKKVIVFRYKNKTRQSTKKGHRQPYTEVEITKVS